MTVYADVSECGRKNVMGVCSGTFMIVNLSSAVIKGNPVLPRMSRSWFYRQNIGSLSSAEDAFKKLNLTPACDENLSVAWEIWFRPVVSVTCVYDGAPSSTTQAVKWRERKRSKQTYYAVADSS
jgi:hypothetical protein